MTRWVLLQHTLPDRSVHLDWMIERPPGGDRCTLLSFRLRIGTDPLAAQRFVAERIGDHRREYLDYEGPVSGGLGEVLRIASGTCRIESGPDPSLLSLQFPALSRRLLGREVQPRKAEVGGEWVFEVASPV